MSQPTEQQIRDWLTEARTARHALIIGEGVVSMSQGGRSLTFNQASIARLDAYIAELEGMLCPSSVRKTRQFTMTQRGDGYSDNGC